MVEILNGASQGEVGPWSIASKLLGRIEEVNGRHGDKIRAMKEARPLFETLGNGMEVRGKFVEFVEDLGGGLRPMYETPDGWQFFVSPFYDPSCEGGGDNGEG